MFYFYAQLFSKQNLTIPPSLDEEPHIYHFLPPLFTFLEFVCIKGWLMVSEAMLNPFGDDDVDIPAGRIIARNIQVYVRAV